MMYVPLNTVGWPDWYLRKSCSSYKTSTPGPKVVGGPGCNRCGQQEAAAGQCQRPIPGECSFDNETAASVACAQWGRCGGFVCRADRTDCQARGLGPEYDAALIHAGFAPLKLVNKTACPTYCSGGVVAAACLKACSDSDPTECSCVQWREGDPPTCAKRVQPWCTMAGGCDISCASPRYSARTFLKTPPFETEPFGQYSERIFGVAIAKLAVQPIRARAWLQAGLVVLTFAAMACVWVAFAQWDAYCTSRRAVLLGWLCVFLGPMAVSVFPVRLFVDWHSTDAVLADYTVEFRAQFDIEAAQAGISKVCDVVTNGDEGDGMLNTALNNVCGTIDAQLPPKLHIFYAYGVKVGCGFAQGILGCKNHSTSSLIYSRRDAFVT